MNEVLLCVKGTATLATHESSQRVRSPKYRSPGSDQWVETRCDEELDRIAITPKGVRDSSWIATENEGEQVLSVQRTDSIAPLGGAAGHQPPECFVWTKFAQLLGTNFIEHQARM